MENIAMSVVARADLVAALLGHKSGGLRSLVSKDVDQLGPEEFGLLYQSSEAPIPAAVVVRSDSVGDLFAWIDTYAPQFSPITQQFRVVSFEVARLYAAGRIGRGKPSLVRALAGVVVGELLAQTARVAMRSLESVTLNHAQATFSFCLSRSELLRSAGFDSRGKVLDGLDTLGGLGLFPDRLVPASDLF